MRLFHLGLTMSLTLPVSQLQITDSEISLAQSQKIYARAPTSHTALAQRRLASHTAIINANKTITVGDLHFGAGIEFLALADAWLQRNPTDWLHYIGIEQAPLQYEDIATLLNEHIPFLSSLQDEYLLQYPECVSGMHRLIFHKAKITLTLCFGPQALQLKRLNAQVNVWLNTELLSPAHFALLEPLSASGASIEFTQIANPDWFEQRFKTTPHTHIATVNEPRPAKPSQPWLLRNQLKTEKTVSIIGAGIAGCSAARALADRGWQVTVFEKSTQAGNDASGNPLAIIYPKLSPPLISDLHFQQQAYLFALTRFKQWQLKEQGIWQPCGVLWFIAGNQIREGEKLAEHPWPSHLVRKVDSQEASHIAGIDIPFEALYFPSAGCLKPRDFCEFLLDHPNITTHFEHEVIALNQSDRDWHIKTHNGHIAQSANVIIANAYSAKLLSQTQSLTLTPVRGQIAKLDATDSSKALNSVLCYGGYLSPCINDKHCIGASFIPNDQHTDIRAHESTENRQALAQYLPDFAAHLANTDTWQARASLRCQTKDYLPVIGPLPDYEQFNMAYAGLKNGNARLNKPIANLPGLYCQLAFGSKGFTTALLAAEVLCAELNNEPYPIAREVLDSLHPARIWVRDLKKNT